MHGGCDVLNTTIVWWGITSAQLRSAGFSRCSDAISKETVLGSDAGLRFHLGKKSGVKLGGRVNLIAVFLRILNPP